MSCDPVSPNQQQIVLVNCTNETYLFLLYFKLKINTNYWLWFCSVHGTYNDLVSADALNLLIVMSFVRIAVFILGSKPARSADLDRGLTTFCLNGGLFWSTNLTSQRVQFFHLHCNVNPSHRCASNCMRWAEVSMTCTVVRFTAGEF